MNSSSDLDALLETLHEDVIQSFARIGAILDSADHLGINWSGDKLRTERARRGLGEHAESVRRLELVMPIVAPMKAGKSTLINAIVGYPLLPARANPMTTLPTRIKLVDGLDASRPELTIPDSTIALFEEMAAQIRQKITGGGWTVPAAHSHLEPLAKSIGGGQADPLRPAYQGSSAIQAVLMRLNDQLRLAVLATGDPSFLSDIHDFPEISTGHRGSHLPPAAAGGQLVIVDTPGPNEHGMAAALGPALEAQLRNSHVVLVVLDYTQMGSDAAAEVGDRLQSHLKIITTSKIVAVVNKVDERKKAEDLTKEQTRAAVRSALGLSEEQSQTQVFETVARWGLTGAQMLADIDRLGDALHPAESQSASALLREVHPFDWADLLRTVSLAELKRDADMVLDRSGVSDLIGSAIARLRAGAAPTVIESGIHRYQDAIAKLSGILALERKSAERGSTAVAKELDSLSGEMEQLRRHRDAMPDVPTLEQRFRDDLAGFVQDLEGQGYAVIELLEKASDQPVGGFALTDAFKSVFRNTKRALWEGVLRGKPDEDLHEFQNQAEAEAFMARIAGSVTEELRDLLDKARRQLDDRAANMAAEVVGEQEKKVRELVERAARKLEVAFNVTLQVPPVTVVNGLLDVELTDPTVRTWSTTESYQTTERRRAWFKAWIGFHDVPVTRTQTVSRSSYQVSRRDVAGQLRAAFDEHLANLRGGLDTYVATEVSSQLTAYYAGLDGYLQSYFAALRRSQDGFKHAESDQAQRRSDLASLTLQLTAELEKLGDQLSRLTDYLHRQPGIAGP